MNLEDYNRGFGKVPAGYTPAKAYADKDQAVARALDARKHGWKACIRKVGSVKGRTYWRVYVK